MLIDFFNSTCRMFDSWEVDPMGVMVSRVVVSYGMVVFVLYSTQHDSLWCRWR